MNHSARSAASLSAVQAVLHRLRGRLGAHRRRPRAAEVAADAFVADAARALRGIILHLPGPSPGGRAAPGIRRRRAPAPAPRDRRDHPSPSRPAERSTRPDRYGPAPRGNGRSASPSRSATTSGSAAARSALAIVTGLAGDVDGGLRLMRPVVRLVEDAGTDVFVPGMAQAMGLLQLRRDDPEAAASWFEREGVR